jgi:hypothetical protein
MAILDGNCLETNSIKGYTLSKLAQLANAVRTLSCATQLYLASDPLNGF